MLTLILVCYSLAVFVAFKVVKIKVTPVSATVAVLGGVFVVLGMVTGWKITAPMTDQVVLRRRVLQVIPDVQEFVSKVHVHSDQAVSKGDPLFEVNAQRFQQAVDKATADLAGAASTVSQLESAVAAAEAAVRKSKAETETAKADLDSAKALDETDSGAVSKLQVQEATQRYNAALADDNVTEATLKQSEYALAAAEHAVDVSQALLNTANFNLERCAYKSPVDGRVMNWQITENTPAARYRFTSIGTVMDQSDTAILAIYPQNLLKFVEPGNPVELTFKRMPGQIATGKVDRVIMYTGEGQFLADAVLPRVAGIGSKGFLAVRITLDDEELARTLPLGAAGSTAIYTNKGKPFHLLSKVAIRMKMWMDYLPK